MAFLNVPGLRRKKKGRVGVGSLRPAVLPSTPKAAARIAEVQPEVLKVQEKRTTATAKHIKTEPVESPSMTSGRSVGGRSPRNSTRIPSNPDIIMPMGPSHYRGTFSSKTIEFQDELTPPGPIVLDYECRQNGSTKRLDMYKKMYKGSTYELDTPSLVVGGAEAQKDKKIQPSTMAGYGRSNIHWPYAWNDYTSDSAGQLTSRTGCFTRTQIENTLVEIFKDAQPFSTFPDVQSIVTAIELSIGGDQRIDFPLDYIECQYKYLNNNVSLPMELSLYLCVPKRNLTAAHSPMYDWYAPFTTQSRPDLMLQDYVYNPVLTGSPDVMFQANATGTVTGVSMVNNRKNIITASTEVVPEATPQGFSVKFRRNWDVKHVQKIVLQPQQELILNLKVKMSKLLDFKQFLSFDANADRFELFKDMSIFPMLKFRGYDTTGVSKGLKRSATATKQNRFLTTTAPRSGPCMLSSTMKINSRCYVTNNYPRDMGASVQVNDVLDCFQTTKRELESYNSLERGENIPYFRINDNLGYFADEDTKPATNTFYTSVVELNVKNVSGSVPTTDASLLSQAANYLPVASSNTDWGVVDINTTTRNILRQAESDIKKS